MSSLSRQVLGTRGTEHENHIKKKPQNPNIFKKGMNI